MRCRPGDPLRASQPLLFATAGTETREEADRIADWLDDPLCRLTKNAPNRSASYSEMTAPVWPIAARHHFQRRFLTPGASKTP